MYTGEMERRIAQLTQGFEAERAGLQNTLNERDQRLNEANQRTVGVERQLVDARAALGRATEANNTLQVLIYPLIRPPPPPSF